MRWTNRWRKRLRALLRRDAVETELDEELAFHLEMETEKNLRAGMAPDQARRQARLVFGAAERFREEVRDARALGWLNGLSLDARLGARMLRKNPALTLVGGFGMAVAIAIAAVFDASMGAANAPLPFEGGERVVALEVWDAETRNQEERLLHDLGVWRQSLRSLESLGAYRGVTRNLVVPGGSPEPALLAEMSPEGFDLIAPPPLLGRRLLARDEAPGAPPVAVIGHRIWQSRFAGDPGVVGREVRIGETVHTIVGVMPEGFGFPHNFALWTPLRMEAAAPRDGPRLYAFGRLAAGVGLAEAQAELTAVGRRLAARSPATHQYLRPRVVQFGPHLMDDLQGWEIPALRLVIVLLLLIIAVNVSILVFARTATRSGEIAVRTALGASRRRIVAQFFAEGLVLAGAAAVLGLAVAALVLRRLHGIMDGALAMMGGLPYWLDFRLSPSAVLFAVALAALAALVIGVIPALRATGGRVESALRALGGGTGLRMGRTWSLLIVAQVAFTVTILPATLFFAVDFARHGVRDPGFPIDEYLSTELVLDPSVRAADPAAAEARYPAAVARLRRRLQAEPLRGVTLTVGVPTREPGVRFQVEGSPDGRGTAAGYGLVDTDFVGAFDVPVLAGRAFRPGDPGAAPVLVNRAFVREALHGAPAVGRRVRLAEGHRSGGEVRVPEGLEDGRWYEIVGVVGDLPARPMEPGAPLARVYRPLAGIPAWSVSLTARTRGPAAAYLPRLRELAAEVDPALQTRELQPLGSMMRMMQRAMRMGALGLVLLTGSVLLLCAAGIYALMSFTVTQRRREIGIRVALGARPGWILAGVFRRAAAQLGTGAGLGLALATGANLLSEGEMTGGAGGVVLPGVAGLMLAVGLLATLGPARRGLGVEPMEALREQ